MKSSPPPLPRGRRVTMALGAAAVGAAVLISCAAEPDSQLSTPAENGTHAATATSTAPSVSADAAATATSTTEWATVINGQGATTRIPIAAADVTSLHAEIVTEHQFPGAPFVQGLEFEDDGSLLVSTGHYGQSQIYRLPQWVENPGTVTPQFIQDLPPEFFGEGLTRHNDTVWQLTWREHVVMARDAATLVEKQRAPLEREGWGLCSFDDLLVLSDGTGTLTLRDPATFAKTAEVPVQLGGEPTSMLNELECVTTEHGREVWANIWQTNTIVRIDPATGAVTATVDAKNLFDALPDDARHTVDVLNGIAKIPGTDRYLITGKRWPLAFEVRFTG